MRQVKSEQLDCYRNSLTNLILTNYLTHEVEAVGTPKELALRMARLAHMIRNLSVNAFAKEPESGSLHNQLAAF